MDFIKYSGRAAAVGAPSTAWIQTTGQTSVTGTAASEMFFGGDGVTITGGAGDDTYYLYVKNDKAVEAADGGVDTIVSWRSISLANFANIENLQVGSDGNYAVGNGGDNIISGLDGRQQIYGGLGEDVLAGGAGNDVFIVRKGEGNDVVQDFAIGQDKVRLDAGITSFSALQSHLSQVGADTLVDLGGGDGLILRNTTASQLSAGDFLLPLDASTLGGITFADEFSGALSLYDSIDARNGVWTPDFGFQGANGLGSYTLASNGEKQIYTSPYFRDHKGDFSESPFVMNGDGTMSIWAKPSSNPEIFGYGFTSGALTTANTFAQTYGYFEIRADVPTAAGAWPAFWLVPNDGSWPPELDVMETLSGEPDVAHTTVHTAASGSHTSATLENYVVPTADGMHTYGTLWTPTELIYYVDRVEVFRTATPADMNKPMHLIVNMALGGWAGDVDLAALPAEFKIDYVRAYSLGAGSATASTITPPTVTPPIVTAPVVTAPVVTPPAVVGRTVFTLPVSAESNNWLHGTDKKDTLTGTALHDFIDGKAGADTMTGGGGDDLYTVDIGGDRVVELVGGGVDTVLSTTSSLTLAANVENVRLVSGGAQSATGNELGNLMTGGWGSTVLDGGAGDDILVAGTGANTLTGGAGSDVFRFDSTPNFASKITDFKDGVDMLDLRGLVASAHYTGSDPLADHYVSLQSDGAGGTNVYFDADGAGAGVALLVTNVAGMAPSAFDTQSSAGHLQDLWLL